jgi:hypothetical protein
VFIGDDRVAAADWAADAGDHPAAFDSLVFALQAGGLLGVTEAMVECSEADLGELVAQQVAQDALPTLGWQ